MLGPRFALHRCSASRQNGQHRSRSALLALPIPLIPSTREGGRCWRQSPPGAGREDHVGRHGLLLRAAGVRQSSGPSTSGIRPPAPCFGPAPPAPGLSGKRRIAAPSLKRARTTRRCLRAALRHSLSPPFPRSKGAHRLLVPQRSRHGIGRFEQSFAVLRKAGLRHWPWVESLPIAVHTQLLVTQERPGRAAPSNTSTTWRRRSACRLRNTAERASGWHGRFQPLLGPANGRQVAIRARASVSPSVVEEHRRRQPAVR